MLETGKAHKLIFFAFLAVILANPALAETSLKPYSPFDEPKPRIPREIMEDKRLDVKVNVFVKSKNFRDLFAEITRQTGVKLTTERSTSAERAIIYFHARPLRDVMTEVSGLFGYYWLPKGEPGAYSYELREDSRHAKYRDDLRQTLADRGNKLLIEFLKQSANPNSEGLKNFQKANPDVAEWMQGDYCKQITSLFSKLGTDFLAQILAANRTNVPFTSLPPDVQAAILEWRNAETRWAAQKSGQPAPALTLADMAKSSVQFNRLPSGTVEMPYIEFSMMTNGQIDSRTSWPSLSEKDIRMLMNQDVSPEKLVGDKLPDEPEITTNSKRKDFRYGNGIPWTSWGDVLQAIAEQSGKDIIADYYFQEMYPKPATKEPLGKLTKRLCDELDYSCQAEGSTLRFRFSKWFVQPLQEEPPARLVEAWWNKIETVGRLEINDLLDLASLPDKQMLWTGLRFMPGPSRARKSPATLRLWNSLRPELEKIARSEEGLSLDRLSQAQLDALYDWAKLMQVSPTANWENAVIRITTRKTDIPSYGEHVTETFTLDMGEPGKPQVTIEVPMPVKETERKELAAQRKADAEADKVEVAQ